MWDSIDQKWIASGMLPPLAGLAVGLKLLDPDVPRDRKRLRAVLLVMAIALGTIGNYLAFVIATRTWYADQFAAGEQSLAYQVTHPDSLPGLKSAQQGLSDTEETWLPARKSC
jgi:hypothetical protein